MRGLGARRWAAVAVLVLAGCTDGGVPPNPVEGLIVDVDGSRMTVEVGGGRSYEFTIADPTVSVAHLRVHMRDRLPVRVTWRSENDHRKATTIADAPAP